MNYNEAMQYKNEVCKKHMFLQCINCCQDWTVIETCEYEAFRK